MSVLVEYLGDGVYASFDGYHVVLDLRGQDDTTRICLEPAVFKALVEFQRKVTIGLRDFENSLGREG